MILGQTSFIFDDTSVEKGLSLINRYSDMWKDVSYVPDEYMKCVDYKKVKYRYNLNADQVII